MDEGERKHAKTERGNYFVFSKLKMFKAAFQVTGAWVTCPSEKQKYSCW